MILTRLELLARSFVENIRTATGGLERMYEILSEEKWSQRIGVAADLIDEYEPPPPLVMKVNLHPVVQHSWIRVGVIVAPRFAITEELENRDQAHELPTHNMRARLQLFISHIRNSATISNSELSFLLEAVKQRLAIDSVQIDSGGKISFLPASLGHRRGVGQGRCPLELLENTSRDAWSGPSRSLLYPQELRWGVQSQQCMHMNMT